MFIRLLSYINLFKKTLCFIFGFSILIILFSCKKDKVTFRYIPENTKNECIFNKGSYWIYRNDNNGITDSTYVYETPSFYFSNNFSSELSIQECKMLLNSSLFSSFILSAYIITTPGVSLLTSVKNVRTCCSGFLTYFKTDDNKEDGDSYCKCNSLNFQQKFNKERISNYKVNDLIFNKVEIVKVTSQIPFTSKFDTLEFYFSPGNGIVKIKMNIDTAKDIIQSKRAIFNYSLLRYTIK